MNGYLMSLLYYFLDFMETRRAENEKDEADDEEETNHEYARFVLFHPYTL